jgi:hypothetical protein
MGGADRPGQVVAEEHQEDAHHRPLERGAGAVDRPWRLRRGAGEVDDEAVALLGEAAADRVELVLVAVVVEVDAVEPGAVGHLAEVAADDLLDVVDDLLLGGAERLHPVVLDQLVDAAVGDRERGQAAAQVERVVVGGARVAQEDRLDVGAQLEALNHLHGREQRCLAVAVAGADDEAARHRAADVLVVHRQPRPADDLPLPEDRRDQHAVVGVQCPAPGVVGEEHVALADILGRPLGEDLLDEEVDRRSVVEDVDAGDEAVSIGGEDAGVEVVDLVDHRRAGHPRGDHRLLVVDRPQPVADHLEGDRVQCRVRHSRLAGRTHRTAPTAASGGCARSVARRLVLM